MRAAADVAVGDQIPPTTVPVRRADLIAYAAASGDHNVIHWNERIAVAVGLPNVIAHGMLTMAIAGRVATEWAGDAGSVVDYAVRFSRPVAVPDDDRGAQLTVAGRVESTDLAARTATVVLTVSVDEVGVLSGARIVLQLA